MNKENFVRRLFVLFPPEKNYEEAVTIYLEELEDGKNYDYRRLFRKIVKDYMYKTTPSVSYILERMSLFEIKPTPRLSGREGETVKKTINGHEYEFTIVSNDWKCKTIAELDKLTNKSYWET